MRGKAQTCRGGAGWGKEGETDLEAEERSWTQGAMPWMTSVASAIVSCVDFLHADATETVSIISIIVVAAVVAVAVIIIFVTVIISITFFFFFFLFLL